MKSLYIHFPFCSSICNYCDFYKLSVAGSSSKERRRLFNEYAEYLKASYLKLQQLYLGSALAPQEWGGDPLETVYIGGGSPILWQEAGVAFIKEFFTTSGQCLDLVNGYEFTLEINPFYTGDANGDGDSGNIETQFGVIEQWIDVGVNRFSLGVQTIDPERYSYLGRKYRLKDVFRIMDFFARHKINYSIDLLLGIPLHTSCSFSPYQMKNQLDHLMEFAPNHISAYILTPPKHYPDNLLQRLPTEDYIREEYLFLSEYLRSKGYLHYEVSNFALPDKRSQHNLRYWRWQSVAAIGPSATGFLVLSESKAQAIRYKWQNKWRGELGPDAMEIEMLFDSESWLERFYLCLRTDMGLDPAKFFEGEELQKFHDLLEMWEKRSYLCSRIPLVRLSPLGYLMLDSLMDELFSRSIIKK
ncbi:MAG: radical SAM protein [Oligoflexia bacterium]|nr:radical SAM protein [Oligoflexia bacterium]